MKYVLLEAMSSAVYLKDLPEKLKKYEVIGKGKTSLVLKLDKDFVLIVTRDKIKREWLSRNWGLGLGEEVEELYIKCARLPDEYHDLYVIKMPVLYKLSPANKKRIKREMDIFSDYYYNYGKSQHYDLLNNLREDPGIVILQDFLKFISNYDDKDFLFDLHLGNFMQDSKGNIIVIDPVIDTNLYNVLNKKYLRNMQQIRNRF